VVYRPETQIVGAYFVVVFEGCNACQRMPNVRRKQRSNHFHRPSCYVVISIVVAERVCVCIYLYADWFRRINNISIESIGRTSNTNGATPHRTRRSNAVSTLPSATENEKI
jgi:hypothetical protein